MENFAPLSGATSKALERFDVMRGALRKLGNGYLSGWNERFFVLDNFGSLRYYEDELASVQDPTRNVKKAIHLSSITGMKVVSKMESGHPGLLLTTPEREYRLEGGSIDELTQWMQAIRLVSEGCVCLIVPTEKPQSITMFPLY